MRTFEKVLNRSGHRPDKCSETEEGFGYVEITQTFEEWLNPVIFNECQHGGSERGPCMCAVMRFTCFTATALNITESSETPAAEAIENFYDGFVMSLIV